MRAGVGFVALGFFATAGRATAAETWVEVKTPHFLVVSNAGDGGARKTAAEFEQVRAAYAKLWPSAHLTLGKPTVVIALRDEASLKRWLPGHYELKGALDLVSMSTHGADRDYLLLRVDARPRSPEVTPNYNLYRSYLSLLLSASFARRLPVWLSNGFAVVFGNTAVRDQEIRVGQPVPWEFQYFNTQSRLPLRTILGARADSPLLMKDDQRRLFDAQCYVLVHYLLFSDRGARGPQLSRFQQLWLAGASHDKALSEAFGDLDALEAQLPIYATRPLLTYARFDTETPQEKDRPSAHPFPAAEVLGLQAAVHVAMDRPVEAQKAIQEARLLDGRAAVSYDAEGLLADRDHDKPRATQAYAQAVDLGSTNAHSHYRAAQLAWKSNGDAAALTALRQRLEKALALNEAFANAHSYLADVLSDLGDGASALEHALRAVALEPAESYHRVALGRALHKRGRNEEARKAAELGLQLADDDQDRSNAERFLLYLGDVARYADEHARQESARKQRDACQGGDRAACAELLPDLERSCGNDEPGACPYLAWLYSGSAGLAKDAAKAAGYLERGCAAGDKRACVEHAWAIARGEGVAKDEAKAVAALDALCSGDYLPACTRLAFVYVAKPAAADRARAKALLARACAGGQEDACTMAAKVR
jgi:tetratricopeptide (TPR) repeat protein